MPAGRPSKYDPSFCGQAIEYGKQGMSKHEIAFNLGVTPQTLYNWMDAHEEFFDAIKQAEAGMEAWFGNVFRGQATGAIEKGSATAAIFLAKNQLPNVYRDRRETQIDAKVGVFEIEMIDFTGYDEEQDTEDWEE
jgi:transposase-like protein